ncbi:MAG: hypothetical protein KDB84_11540, partial [Flavobacteriales bacterium]|nr:hypothetical protein [Flavobacteriales bacterium]
MNSRINSSARVGFGCGFAHGLYVSRGLNSYRTIAGTEPTRTEGNSFPILTNEVPMRGRGGSVRSSDTITPCVVDGTNDRIEVNT